MSSSDSETAAADYCAACKKTIAEAADIARLHCGHSICRACTLARFDAAIPNAAVEFDPPTCRAPGCGEVIRPRGRVGDFLSTAGALDSSHAWHFEMSKMRGRRLGCPEPTCRRAVYWEQDIHREDERPAPCALCLGVQCQHCRVHEDRVHDEHRCPRQPRPDGGVSWELVGRLGWRKCCDCILQVRVAAASELMLCRCGCVFCHACGKKEAECVCAGTPSPRPETEPPKGGVFIMDL